MYILRTDQRWEHFMYTGSYLVSATSSWRFLKGKRRCASSSRCCNSMHELTHHQVHGKPLSHIDTAIIQAFCSRETLKMYQRNATTALKPIFPAHNQGNAHMCLESTGSQSFFIKHAKIKICFRRSAEFIAFQRPRPAPAARSPPGCSRPPPRAPHSPHTPLATGEPALLFFGRGDRRESAHTHAPPLPFTQRAQGRVAPACGDLSAKLRGGYSTETRLAAPLVPPARSPESAGGRLYLHVTSTSWFQMERGARREEARGLRARAAAAPRDPQPASAGARTGTRAADTRARAAPAPPAGSGSRPGAEAPLAAPPQSSRSARPSRRLGSSDSSRPAPRRSGERRIVLRRLGRGSGGRRGKKSGERRTEEPRGEGGGHLHPPASSHSDWPEGPHEPGLSLTGRGTASHGPAAAPRAAPAGRQRRPGRGGAAERCGGAFPAGERASARGGRGGRTCCLLPSSPPSHPPHAGSIATNMAAAQSAGGGRKAAPESSREPKGGGHCALLSIGPAKGRGQDQECTWHSDWLGAPWLKAAVGTDWPAEPSLTPVAAR